MGAVCNYSWNICELLCEPQHTHVWQHSFILQNHFPWAIVVREKQSPFSFLSSAMNFHGQPHRGKGFAGSQHFLSEWFTVGLAGERGCFPARRQGHAPYHWEQRASHLIHTVHLPQHSGSYFPNTLFLKTGTAFRNKMQNNAMHSDFLNVLEASLMQILGF